MITLNRILVPTDFSEPSDAALTYGRELAIRFGATLHVLHVAQDLYLQTYGGEHFLAMVPEVQRQIENDARRRLDELVLDSDHSGPPTVPAVVTAVSTATAIVEYARVEDINLIVVGTHGRGALAHLVLGSVAERVVRFAPCPVLTVRHPEREFVRPDALAAVADA